MQNIKLTLQYDGTRYLGWQKPQKNGMEKTVSFRVSSVLERLTGFPVILYAGAKTEPHVHALAQTVSFYTESPLSADDFLRELNRYLPQDIAVIDCRKVPDRFRADLNAVSRTYEYRICTSPVYDVFTHSFSAHIYPEPDIKAMQQAAALLTGRHDFRGFCCAGKKKDTKKEILGIRFIRSDSQVSSLAIRITATDFLCQMPSLIIGSLLKIGCARSQDTVCTELHNLEAVLSGQKKAESPCDSRGLLLHSIQYK